MRNFLVIGRPHRRQNSKGGNIRDREKTSMQMDRPVEFSSGTRGCSCVSVNTASFSLPRPSSPSRAFVYGHTYSRRRAAGHPSFQRAGGETKGKLTDVQWFSKANQNLVSQTAKDSSFFDPQDVDYNFQMES